MSELLSDDPYRQVEVSFTVKGEPATKSRARVVRQGGKVHTYTPEATKRAEAAVRAAFLSTVNRLAPSNRLAFGVDATFYMASGMRRDVDNMLKVILDGLNKVAWGDDWQVIEVTGRKRSVPTGEARTEVRLWTAGVLEERTARCEHCGETFPRPPSHAAKKYCSMECRRAGIEAKRTRSCKQCGEKFVRHNNVSEQAYCSRDCAHRAKHIEVTCVRCGKRFTKARSLNRSGNAYCSEECKATYWREQRKSAAKGKCQDCGGPTTKKSYKRCRDCAYAAGGRWADRDEVTCPICHSFVADGGTCQREHARPTDSNTHNATTRGTQ